MSRGTDHRGSFGSQTIPRICPWALAPEPASCRVPSLHRLPSIRSLLAPLIDRFGIGSLSNCHVGKDMNRGVGRGFCRVDGVGARNSIDSCFPTRAQQNTNHPLSRSVDLSVIHFCSFAGQIKRTSRDRKLGEVQGTERCHAADVEKLQGYPRNGICCLIRIMFERQLIAWINRGLVGRNCR